MSSAIARRRPPAVRSLISRARTRRRIVLVAAVVVVAGAAAGAWLARPASPAGATTRIVPVTRTTLSQTLSASGTIEPKKSATLSFSAPGQVIAVEALLGLAGGVLGAAVGLAGAILLPHLIPDTIAISPAAVAGSIAVAVVIGLVFGVYPASRAARLAPIDALRTE